MSNVFNWAVQPCWQFCPVACTAGTRYAVKIIPSVESPYVGEKQCDGPMTVRTLINSAQKLVGYSFTFKDTPAVKDLGFSLAVSYGVPDSNEMLLVLGSPHLRALRLGTDIRTYHVVLRHKSDQNDNRTES